VGDTRWRQMDALFDALLELPEEEREAALDRGCKDDPELRRAVERLMAAEAEAGTFLATPAVPRAAIPSSLRHAVGPADDLVGTRVGPYRLVRFLGDGGMGTVYLSQREDDYRQEVAIKLVRQSAIRPEARRRLRTERQALARLAHPNIARLYDGGSTPEGVPYLVMERVDGLPIDRFCDGHRLGLRKRLGLVLQVLDAVAHAHRHLRVHCDIKPSNILVTGEGVPKLLDFGIAKLLDPVEGSDLAVTATGLRPLTPAYASPEQIEGSPITAASDLYSVGVLLYELLCGRPPYDVDDASGPAMGRAILETEPVPPSRRVSRRGRRWWRRPAKPQEGAPPTDSPKAPEVPSPESRRGLTPRLLRSRLRGDLDAIVLKAIRKEPGQRYPTAEAFATDIERHLQARPVGARQGTWRYRAARLLRRAVLPPEPRRRRERWAWAGGLVLVTGLASIALSVDRPSNPCPIPGNEIESIWNDSSRETVREVFLATGLPFAADTFDRASAAIDRYVRGWNATDLEICEATLVRGELSTRELYLGRLCLDGRREELRTLVDLFGHPDAHVVTDAVGAVNRLEEVASCADRGALAAGRLPPEDPEGRPRLPPANATDEVRRLRIHVTQSVGRSGPESTPRQERWIAESLRDALVRRLIGRHPDRACQLVTEASSRLDPGLALHRALLREIDDGWGAGEGQGASPACPLALRTTRSRGSSSWSRSRPPRSP